MKPEHIAVLLTRLGADGTMDVCIHAAALQELAGLVDRYVTSQEYLNAIQSTGFPQDVLCEAALVAQKAWEELCTATRLHCPGKRE